MKYALIGKQLAHSYSSFIHSKQGLDYSLYEIQPENIKKFVKSRVFSGYNVTIPYKNEIIKYLDELSLTAQKIGSVNTVNTENEKLVGYNTDVLGLKYLFDRKNIELKDKIVTILGSGGTSKTAQFLCKLKCAKRINVVSRNGRINYQNIYTLLNDTQIIINTTPVGMFPNIDERIVELSKFKDLEFVCDCIYNPLKTDLIIQAQNLNIKCSNGLPMLVKQAIESEKIWLNKIKDNTESILTSLIKEKINLVFYGMPSCGKSTIGKIVAEKLNKEFLDTDILIEKEYKKSPKEIIEKYGEKKFREYENNIIKNISFINNAVISLGGGSVIEKNNVDLLKKNGVFIYIDRNIENLNIDDRPFSIKYGVKKLYNDRKKIYENIIDIKVDNNNSIDLCVKKVINIYENTCYKWC